MMAIDIMFWGTIFLMLVYIIIANLFIPKP